MNRDKKVILVALLLCVVSVCGFLVYFINNFNSALGPEIRGVNYGPLLFENEEIVLCGPSALAPKHKRLYFVGCKDENSTPQLYLSEEGYSLHSINLLGLGKLGESARWRLSASADGEVLALWSPAAKFPESDHSLDLRPRSKHEELRQVGMFIQIRFENSSSPGVTALRDGNFARRVSSFPYPLSLPRDQQLDSVSFAKSSAGGRRAYLVVKTTAGIATEQVRLTQASASLDLNDDAISDLLTFEQAEGAPYWRLKLLNGLETSHSQIAGVLSRERVWRLGDPSGIAVPCDYDGDGSVDLATYTSNFAGPGSDGRGNWQIFFSQTRDISEKRFSIHPDTYRSYYWGFGSARAMPADYDGDGACDLAVFEPETAYWQILLSSGGFNRARALLGFSDAGQSRQWGLPGDLPLTADLDGDGCSDLVVVREEGGRLVWWTSFSPCSFPGRRSREERIVFGKKGDLPFVADFNLDGVDDLIVYRRSTGSWFIRLDAKSSKEIHWKVEGGRPFIGDFDGDAVPDFAFFSSQARFPFRIYSSRYSASLGKVFRMESPVVSKLTWGRDGGVPVQISLRDHQAGN